MPDQLHPGPETCPKHGQLRKRPGDPMPVCPACERELEEGLNGGSDQK